MSVEWGLGHVREGRGSPYYLNTGLRWISDIEDRHGYAPRRRARAATICEDVSDRILARVDAGILWRWIRLHDLTTRELEALWLWVLHPQMTLEAQAKVMDVSRERVRRLRIHALDKISEMPGFHRAFGPNRESTPVKRIDPLPMTAELLDTCGCRGDWYATRERLASS